MYDIANKNSQFEKVREACGTRVFNKATRRDVEHKYNQISHMRQSSAIEQMTANAQERKPPVTLGRLVQN
jgi:thiamine pyrophosphate-dependent acetolactate synthase large subunit-like protein